MVKQGQCPGGKTKARKLLPEQAIVGLETRPFCGILPPVPDGFRALTRSFGSFSQCTGSLQRFPSQVLVDVHCRRSGGCVRPSHGSPTLPTAFKPWTWLRQNRISKCMESEASIQPRSPRALCNIKRRDHFPFPLLHPPMRA